ncbi:hypothetical protein J2S16_002950 [Cytobacillus kochii]|uniref:Uncharacterized protein n=1 Tax=Cytobacillus kochii TaxID=859143 RepID=A0A248THM1_9BACI|nr:hypothetical protein CKF48_09810 [Cytobacillus kochii]MDQ0186342.1 hypothetical protein [Cytobacillus kochii]
MLTHIFLWSMLILPWFILLLLDNKRVKSFIPGGLVSALLLTILFQLYQRYNLIEVVETIFPLTNTTPFVYGIYIVLPTIFLYFTFGNFWLYITINTISDAIFSFGIMNLYEYFGIYKMDDHFHIVIFINCIICASLIYLFQKWQYIDPYK